ncbi:alpha/beta fold hydrolase [Aporhodopirellula aestuarii]|uniref:Alpha/beta hydrolase n=1 Tax=Aporhodopirellula aestuarii TaxID=2950107 RepID=A0ABT0UBF9_9BACT|nr:alpha/beta fold hydrolase [Aporhodopirellula aestuarii]MCM2374253.1 alpha/beta hydrolase [Aporhodopirellula aestuarii]
MKTKLFLVSGWAFGRAALEGVSEQLGAEFDVTCFSSEELLRPGKLAEILPADQECVLAGWSLGGMLALAAAAKLRQGSKLVLIGSTAKFCASDDSPHGVPPAQVRSMAIAFRRQPQQTLANFRRQTALPHPPLPAIWHDQDDWEELLEGLKYLREADLRDVADRLTVPTLVLHGRDDQVISPEAAQDLSRRIQNSELRIHDENGHDLPMRDPQWVAANLLDFWKSDVARPDAG